MDYYDFLDILDRLSNPYETVLRARARRGVTGLVALLALILIPPLFIPWIHGNEGVRNYAYVRSFWMDGNLDFRNEFAHFRETGEFTLPLEDNPETRLPGNALGVGSAILWSPFFLLGHLIAWATGAPVDGYSPPYVWSVCLGSTFYGIAGLLLVLRLVSWRLGPYEALFGVCAVWLGSPLVFYMYLHPSMSHACSFFLCALTLWEYERWRISPRLYHFYLIGLTVGLAMATRLENTVFLLFLGAFCLRTWHLAAWEGTHLHWCWKISGGFLTGLGVLVGFLPQMAAWHTLQGSWFAGPSSEGAGTLLWYKSPYAFDVLISGWRGLFVWSPVLFLAAVGFALLLRRWRLVDIVYLVMFLLQVWVIGGYSRWWGGASFGQVFFLGFTPAFALGLAWLFASLRPGTPRNMFLVCLLGSLLWSAGLGVQYVGGLIPRDGEVSFHQLYRNQIKKVPWVIREQLECLLPADRFQRVHLSHREGQE